jgi:glyceraldehyde-3-phosphate dehydrogenase (NADP+)
MLTDSTIVPPFVDGTRVLINGVVEPWTGDVVDVTSPILNSESQRILIGKQALMDATTAERAVLAAKSAWNTGRGIWPQSTMEARITAVQNFVLQLKSIRGDIVSILMWEICKNTADAAAEFDRTMLFVEATIAAIRSVDATQGGYTTVSGVQARVRRAAIGVMLALGPFNYPVSEKNI